MWQEQSWWTGSFWPNTQDELCVKGCRQGALWENHCSSPVGTAWTRECKKGRVLRSIPEVGIPSPGRSFTPVQDTALPWPYVTEAESSLRPLFLPSPCVVLNSSHIGAVLKLLSTNSSQKNRLNRFNLLFNKLFPSSFTYGPSPRLTFWRVKCTFSLFFFIYHFFYFSFSTKFRPTNMYFLFTEAVQRVMDINLNKKVSEIIS